MKIEGGIYIAIPFLDRLANLIEDVGGIKGVTYVMEFAIFSQFLFQESLQIHTRMILKYTCPNQPGKPSLDTFLKAKGTVKALRRYNQTIGLVAFYGHGAFASYADAVENCIEFAEFIRSLQER